MAEERKGLGLIETKGQFQVKGVVTGTEKSSFYKETRTKTDKPFRAVNFGVQFDKDSTMYVGLTGMEQEKVYFSKSDVDPATKKRITAIEKVAWKDRYKFDKEGFRLIGVNVGVSKVKDSKGNDVNDKKMLTPYDACNEISSNLTDGASVFVRGNIEYSTYENKRQVRFVPNQVSLCKDVDFEADGFEPEALFQQTIVFMGIRKGDTNGKYLVDAKIVGYNSVEDAEFVVTNTALANQMKKGLKPYWSIKVHGHASVEKSMDEVEVSDGWGEENKMTRVNAPTTRELVITGADPTTIDKDIYSEETIDAAIAKISSSKKAASDFGEKDDWGNGSMMQSDGNDEDDAW